MAKISNFVTPDGTKYDIRSTAIPFGRVDSTSTATVFTATVPGITELTDGTCVMLDNGVVTSASGFTLNVNGLGAKPVYSNLAAATRDTTIFNINYTMLFVYDETRVSGGCWVCYRGYDANTNTIGYQLRTNNGNLPASDTGARYRLWFTSADDTKWVPANTSTSTDATTARTLNSRAINPFGPIVYNSTNGRVSSGERPSATTLWQQYAINLGYSFVKSLTAWKPVYVQCTPQTNGSAVMNDITQTLPSSEDGKIYIFLGIAYNATNMELCVEHPVFYHDGTGLRIWTGRAIPTKTSELTNDSGFLTSAPVTSVNSKTGAVSLTASDVGALPSTTTIPTKTSDLTNDSGFITSVPVSSVNSKTGAVVLTASDVGALPSSTTIPTKTSQLTNDSGFITDAGVTSFNGSTGAVTYTAPVTSVNGRTGAVTVTEGLAPLIGTTSTVTATEVKMAIEEGRDVCISYTHSTYGVLEFTSFNVANSMHSVVSQTIVNYNGTILCFELIGVMLSEDTQELWLCTVDTLASSSVIPTKTSDLTNDSGYITLADLPIYDGTVN